MPHSTYSDLGTCPKVHHITHSKAHMTGSEVLSLQQVSAHPPGVDNQHLKAAGHNFSSGNGRHHFPAAGHEGNERQNGRSRLSPAPGPLAQITPCRLGRSPQEKAGPSHGCSAPQVTAGEETTGEDSSTGAPGHLLASAWGEAAASPGRTSGRGRAGRAEGKGTRSE